MARTAAAQPNDRRLSVAHAWQEVEANSVAFIPRRVHRCNAAGAVYTNAPTAAILVRFDDGQVFYLSALEAVRELSRVRLVKPQPAQKTGRDWPRFFAATLLLLLLLCSLSGCWLYAVWTGGKAGREATKHVHCAPPIEVIGHNYKQCECGLQCARSLAPRLDLEVI